MRQSQKHEDGKTRHPVTLPGPLVQVNRDARRVASALRCLRVLLFTFGRPPFRPLFNIGPKTFLELRRPVAKVEASSCATRGRVERGESAPLAES